MVKVLLMVIGLLVLSIAGLGGLIWSAGNQSSGPQTEKGQSYAQNLRSTIKGTCNRFVDSQLGRLADDDEIQQTVHDICECAADMTYNEFKDKPPIQLISLATDSKTRGRIKELMQECLDRADIPRPEEFGQVDWSDYSDSDEE